MRCDVTDEKSVESAAAEAWDRTGGLRVVCLNAGVFAGGYAWETTLDDWDWVMGVNLRGMVNGIRSFVPRLIDAGQPSHLIGTASIAGVVASAASAVYCTSKFAAVGLMESLQHDLGLAGAAHVGTSVICPGMVGHQHRPRRPQPPRRPRRRHRHRGVAPRRRQHQPDPAATAASTRWSAPATPSRR